MKVDFGVVSDSASLQEAAVLMRDRETCVVAVEQGGRIAGTLSQRDLALKGYGEGRDPDKDSVAMVMTPRFALCPLDTDLIAALRLMGEYGVDALLLGAPSKRIVGLVTRLQVLEELADPDKEPRGPLPEHVRRVRGNPV